MFITNQTCENLKEKNSPFTSLWVNFDLFNMTYNSDFILTLISWNNRYDNNIDSPKNNLYSDNVMHLMLFSQ